MSFPEIGVEGRNICEAHQKLYMCYLYSIKQTHDEKIKMPIFQIRSRFTEVK